MHVTGSCHCGTITFAAEIDPDKVRICHCTDCQTLSGAPFRATAPCPEDRFTLLTGTPKIYIKTSEAGRKREQAFCADCGTPLYATSVGDGPRTLGLRTGALDQRDQLVPKRQFWTRSAQAWLADLPHMTGYDTQ